MHSQTSVPAAIAELWGVARLQRRGPQPRFTVDDVAGAAVVAADREGLGGLALSSVAADLGIATTGLYRYVDSKDTLIEIAVNHAIGPAPRLGTGAWQDEVRRWSHLLLAVYQAHPWLSEVRPTGVPRTPNPLSWIESFLGAVEGAIGITDPMSAALLVDGVVRTYAAMLRSVGSADAADVTAVVTYLKSDRGGGFPRLARAVQRDWSDVEQEFEFAIGTVLSGLAKRPK